MFKMDMIKLVIKNILRNKKRSFLTSSSLLVAGFVIVALHGYINGVFESSRNMIIRLDTGHVLICKNEYFERRSFIPVEEYIENLEEIEKMLTNSKYVDFYIFRIKLKAFLFTKNEKSKYGIVIGFDPIREKRAFNIESKIIDGKYDLEKGAIVGKDLAKVLKLSIYDSLTIITKSSVGGISAIKVPVVGIVSTGFSNYDRNLVILSLENARKLLKIKNGVHEVIVFLKKESFIPKFLKSIRLPKEISAKSYLSLLGIWAFYYKFGIIFYSFIYILITLLAAFSIINTMMVAVFERMQEIGTLKAIGMNDKEIFNIFAMEGTLLGSFGGLLGSLIGFIFNTILKIKGINFEEVVKGIEFPYPYIVRPTTSLWIVLFSFFLVTLISFITSILPALKAKNLTPQDALKHV